MHPPSKKNKVRYSSISTCNIVQDSNDNIVLNSHVNVTEDMDSSGKDNSVDLNSNSVSSITSVASIVSKENSTDYLPTDFESEDSSSVNHHFVSDSEVSNSSSFASWCWS